MVLVTPPVSKGGNAGGCFMDQYQQYSAHCETADSGNGSDLESTGVPTKPDDSEESGPSSLGSDSMHGSSTEYVRQAASQPSGQRQRQKSLRVLGALLPDSLLRDIRDRRSTEYVVTFSQTEEEEKIPVPDKIPEKPSPFRLARESLSEEKIEELRAAVERANFVQTGEEPLDSIDATSLSLPASSNIGGHRSNISYKYADDQYYSFHINEHENFGGFSSNREEVDEAGSESGILTEQQDLFAGYRDVRCGASSTQSTIRSAKGTVRGVKNRVRNGIATFLQLQQQPNAKVSAGIKMGWDNGMGWDGYSMVQVEEAVPISCVLLLPVLIITVMNLFSCNRYALHFMETLKSYMLLHL